MNSHEISTVESTSYKFSEDQLRIFEIARTVLRSDKVRRLLDSIRVHPGEYPTKCPHPCTDAPGMPVSEDVTGLSKAVHALIEEQYGAPLPYPQVDFEYDANLSGSFDGEPVPRTISVVFSAMADAWNKHLSDALRNCMLNKETAQVVQ